MRKPLSLTPASDPDNELPHPIRLPDLPSGQKLVVADGSSGLPLLTVAVLGCAAAGYGSGYVLDFWPAATPYVATAGPLAGMGLGIILVRAGVVNPWLRMFRRWRRVSLDWKDRALQAENRLDQVARDFTGEEDAATARVLLDERLEGLKSSRRKGRPKHSATGRTEESRREITREIRRLREQGLTWDNIGARHKISGATARNWCTWLDEEERSGMA